MGRGNGEGDGPVVTFYCKDPGSQGDIECDTFYSTDRGSWVVQGKARGADVGAQLVALGDDEGFVEISGPAAAVFVRKYVREHYGIDLGEAAP
ncbi:hypothetical protein [Actinomadura flavalba]|uniref:hypothetical protein n=1 Tax=Actinomadura flavalba TaxID=1120938 RepID=UPI0003648231|nr:hypothetical protein [Actinomadura flavalba]